MENSVSTAVSSSLRHTRYRCLYASTAFSTSLRQHVSAIPRSVAALNDCMKTHDQPVCQQLRSMPEEDRDGQEPEQVDYVIERAVAHFDGFGEDDLILLA